MLRGQQASCVVELLVGSDEDEDVAGVELEVGGGICGGFSVAHDGDDGDAGHGAEIDVGDGLSAGAAPFF